MTFADLVAGDAIFLDANTLVYHFTSDPVFGAACSQLLQRVENQEIQGHTSTHVLTETAHRIMTIEAMGAFAWPSPASPADSGSIPPRYSSSRDSTTPSNGFCKAPSRS
jgi:hypothetical protein